MSDGMPGRESPKFLLRLPGDMRERLKAEAEANNRSMNAEIVSRLQESLDAPALLAELDRKTEADLLRSRYEGTKRQAANISEMMESMTAQLARIEARMAEIGVDPKNEG